jgi:predicted  nucleic acid-binding Zn-ribbon protein
MESLQKSIEVARKSPGPGSDGEGRDERKASGALADKMAELTKARDELSALHGKISTLTSPLDRASKKFDHVSAERRQLHPFIEDPIGTSFAESDYKEFMALVKKLEASVESGSVDVKNKDEVANLTSDLLKSELHPKIIAANSLKSRISELEKEIRALDIILDGLRESKVSSEKRTRNAEELERRFREIEKRRDSAKSEIERLFKEHYGRAILIE